MSIKRYDSQEPHYDPYEAPNGEWVKYSDYERLAQDLRDEQKRYDELRMQHRNCDPSGLVFEPESFDVVTAWRRVADASDRVVIRGAVDEPRVIQRTMSDGISTKDGMA